jgi:hypothetical protein
MTIHYSSAGDFDCLTTQTVCTPETLPGGRVAYIRFL